jgi:hypothetical protein
MSIVRFPVTLVSTKVLSLAKRLAKSIYQGISALSPDGLGIQFAAASCKDAKGGRVTKPPFIRYSLTFRS